MSLGNEASFEHVKYLYNSVAHWLDSLRLFCNRAQNYVINCPVFYFCYVIRLVSEEHPSSMNVNCGTKVKRIGPQYRYSRFPTEWYDLQWKGRRRMEQRVRGNDIQSLRGAQIRQDVAVGGEQFSWSEEALGRTGPWSARRRFAARDQTSHSSYLRPFPRWSLENSAARSTLHQPHQVTTPSSWEPTEWASKTYLHIVSASWIVVEIKLCRGGMSNMLFLCRLAEHHSCTGGEPDKVLLRVYFNPETESHLVAESVIFTLLSERHLGPKLYGIFSGGRLEEYIPVRFSVLSLLHIVCRLLQLGGDFSQKGINFSLGHWAAREIGLPMMARKIAKRLAGIHTLVVPIWKEPDLRLRCTGTVKFFAILT